MLLDCQDHSICPQPAVRTMDWQVRVAESSGFACVMQASTVQASPEQHLAACRLAALKRRVSAAKGALVSAQHEEAVQRRVVMVWDAVAVATFR